AGDRALPVALGFRACAGVLLQGPGGLRGKGREEGLWRGGRRGDSAGGGGVVGAEQGGGPRPVGGGDAGPIGEAGRWLWQGGPADAVGADGPDGQPGFVRCHPWNRG